MKSSRFDCGFIRVIQGNEKDLLLVTSPMVGEFTRALSLLMSYLMKTTEERQVTFVLQSHVILDCMLAISNV